MRCSPPPAAELNVEHIFPAMNMPAVPDKITIVGSNYFQPIADLCESMLKVPSRSSEVPHRENGYAASLVVLLVAVLESYVSRLRFVRQNEIASSKSVPELLANLFPDLPNQDELVEVFLLRNMVIHNHVWHLDISTNDADPKTIKSPVDLGFGVNKHYRSTVDPATRKTKRLAFPANPSAVNRFDAKKVFELVWSTLSFMSSKDCAHTPLGGRSVLFRGRRTSFEKLAAKIE